MLSVAALRGSVSGWGAALRKIFVLEDDPTVRRMLTIILSDAGYETVCFVDSTALFAALRNEAPACILLDVNLPDESGLDVLKRVRAEGFAYMVLMISGYGTIDIALDAIRSGAADFIQKPFKARELVDRIETALAQRVAIKIASSDGDLRLNLPDLPALTKRERDVLRLMLFGKSNKEISRLYGLSPRTIEDHRSNIKKKTGAKNVIDLARSTIGSRLFDHLVTEATKFHAQMPANDQHNPPEATDRA